MNLFEQIKNREEKISVIGLGYVGLPIAVAFAKLVDVIGFDKNQDKINLYNQGIDPTLEVGNEGIKDCGVVFTNEAFSLREAKFHIIAVPTPINQNKAPDLSSVKSASTLLGNNLVKGSIIVYESTVFPGVTEEICIPILEKESGLKCGTDFKVGYSPERINPGDHVHRLENITKVVSGMDQESLETIAKTYELVVKAGVYKAESIKVAEAAKVIENSQRDINIAFMNELSIIFNKLGIDTKSVLAAAATKWNFLNFSPGLVGGHCIGVDPYYLTYKAEQMGYHSQIILSGRRINDNMGLYVAQNLLKNLIKADILIKEAKVAILGLTFKENCPDTRNTKVIDIIKELNEYRIEPLVCDPVADKKETVFYYDIELLDITDLRDLDALVIAVPHEQFKKIDFDKYESMFKKGPNNKKTIIDIKGILDKQKVEELEYNYWRL